MCNLIRKYMGYVDGDFPIGGLNKVVEADETFVGGKDTMGHDDKAVVFGVIERGGDIVTRHVLDRSAESLVPHIVKFAKGGSRIVTDEWSGYRSLTERHGYEHNTVDHSAKEY